MIAKLMEGGRGINGPMDRCTDGLDGRMAEWTDELMAEWTSGPMGWMNGWIDGSIGQQIDELMVDAHWRVHAACMPQLNAECEDNDACLQAKSGWGSGYRCTFYPSHRSCDVSCYICLHMYG